MFETPTTLQEAPAAFVDHLCGESQDHCGSPRRLPMAWCRSLATIPAQLGYLHPTPGRPVSYMYDPPDGTVKESCLYDFRDLRVADARGLAGPTSVHREGFELWCAPSSVASFHDTQAVAKTYYPECMEIACAATGGSAATLRPATWSPAKFAMRTGRARSTYSSIRIVTAGTPTRRWTATRRWSSSSTTRRSAALRALHLTPRSICRTSQPLRRCARASKRDAWCCSTDLAPSRHPDRPRRPANSCA